MNIGMKSGRRFMGATLLTYFRVFIAVMVLTSMIPFSFISMACEVPWSSSFSVKSGSNSDFPDSPDTQNPSIHEKKSSQPSASFRTLEKGPLTYEDVALIVNDNSPMSRDIGDYFVSHRNVPSENIINITVSSGETISRTQFEDLQQQIEDAITSRNLTTKLNYLVTTKGVPLRISGDGDYKASVDSELSLILLNNKNAIGNFRWMVNPYYGSNRGFTSQRYQMYLVTRLTAYTFEEVKAIIDNAAVSLNVTGKFIFDVDPGRDGSPGYKIGNDWLRGANASLASRGFEVIHDETNTFLNNISGVAGYSSWGSNDGHWFLNRLSNSNMQLDNDADGIPNNWYAEPGATGSVVRTDEDSYQGSYSVNISRYSTGPDSSAIFQDFEVEPGARYCLYSYANLSGVSGDGGAYYQIRAHNSQGDVIWMKNGSQKTGTTNDWISLGQGIYEPREGVRRISVGGVLHRSSGKVFFDYFRLNEIRPHLEFVPGAIAETFVSTGGRSFTYPTSYGQSLIADIIREGVTGVKGYTWEPYLSAISHPDILFPRYTSGHNLAESFWSGSNFVSWMGTVVGDPKCTPYFHNRVELGMTNVTISDDMPSQRDEIFINVTVVNSGATDSSSFEVVLRTGSDQPETWTRVLSSLASMDSSTLSFKLNLSELGGMNEFFIIIDEDNTIQEIREDNNFETLELYVNYVPYVDRTLPLIEVFEDTFNKALDLTEGYFLDVESDSLYFEATLIDPDHHQSENVDVNIDVNAEGTFLNVSVFNNYTDENIPLRIYCVDRLPMRFDVYLDTQISILPVNDPPFYAMPFADIQFFEGGHVVSRQLSEKDIFSDIDDSKLYYTTRVMLPGPEHVEIMDEMYGVRIFLDLDGAINIFSPGDYFGNFTMRVYCSDEPFNLTSDDLYGCAYVPVNVTIFPVNDAPEFYEEDIDVEILEDASNVSVFDLSDIFRDIDNAFEDIFWNVSGIIPANKAQFHIENGQLMVSLVENCTQDILVKLEVSDGEYSDECYIHLSIIPVNDVPLLDIQMADVDGKGNLTVEFLFYDSDSLPETMELNISVDVKFYLDIPVVGWHPSASDDFFASFEVGISAWKLENGNHTLYVTLLDGDGGSSIRAVSLFIGPMVENDELIEDETTPEGESNITTKDDVDVPPDVEDETGAFPQILVISILLLSLVSILIYFLRIKKKKGHCTERRDSGTGASVTCDNQGADPELDFCYTVKCEDEI